MAGYFPHDLFPGHSRVIKKFLAERHRHLEVDGVSIYAVLRLPDNNLIDNTAGKVERYHGRIYLLLYESVPLPVKVDKSHAVLGIPEATLHPPSTSIYFL